MSIRHKKIELSQNLKLGIGRGNSNVIFKYGAVICLILAAGLAVNAFRLVFFSSSKEQQQTAEQVLGATDVKDSQKSDVSPKTIEYTVNKGDTLFNISQKFNVSWTTIAALNNLKSPFTVKPGQTLNIPQ